MPESPDGLKRTIPRSRLRAFHALANFIVPSPDGRSVAYGSLASGNQNLWVLDLATGRARQATAFQHRAVRDAVWSPQGDLIVLAADRDGDEANQLFRIAAGGGWPEPLLHRADARFEPAGHAFSPDGTRLLYAGNDRDPAQFDVCEIGIADGNVRRVWTPPDASMLTLTGRTRDGGLALCATHRSNTDVAAWVVDVTHGGGRELLAHGRPSLDIPVAFSPDATQVYMVTDRGRDYRGVATVEADGGDWRYLYAPDHDVIDAAISEDGAHLAIVENIDGYATVRVVGLADGSVRSLDGLPRGWTRSIAWSPVGDALYAVVEDPCHPAELYRVALPGGKVRMLTDAWVGAVERERMVAPDLVRIPGGDDDVEVPVFVYRPHGASAAHPAPVLLSIHGGPEAQESAMYMYGGFYQSLLAAGIGVVAPNIRGSTGFGIGYQKRILRDWGGGELRDLRAVSAFMAGLEWARPDRMAVFGGSFGGFASLSVASRLTEFGWAAAVSVCGPSNLVSFAQSVPPSWRPFMRAWVGDPEDDRDVLVERSPLTYASRVRASLFVLQGALDPRVVETESAQMVEAVRAAGNDVRYDVYPDEGHGFVKDQNTRKAFNDIEDFLEERLLGAVAPSADADGPVRT